MGVEWSISNQDAVVAKELLNKRDSSVYVVAFILEVFLVRCHGSDRRKLGVNTVNLFADDLVKAVMMSRMPSMPRFGGVSSYACPCSR